MKPKPIGVHPYAAWLYSVQGEPTLADLLERYRHVAEAVRLRRVNGLDVPKVWLLELGVAQR